MLVVAALDGGSEVLSEVAALDGGTEVLSVLAAVDRAGIDGRTLLTSCVMSFATSASPLSSSFRPFIGSRRMFGFSVIFFVMAANFGSAIAFAISGSDITLAKVDCMVKKEEGLDELVVEGVGRNLDNLGKRVEVILATSGSARSSFKRFIGSKRIVGSFISFLEMGCILGFAKASAVDRGISVCGRDA